MLWFVTNLTRLRILAAVLGFSACGGATYTVESDAPLYTLTNLRADPRGVVSSLGYADQALIPVCTPVQITSVRGRQVVFVANGRRYRYVAHRSSPSPIDQHVQRLFGPTCPDLARFSAEDRAGVQQGRVFQGMTKAGVVVAMGYPPERFTPTLDADVWTYVRRQGGRLQVQFAGGQVVGLVDPRAPQVVAQPLQPVVQPAGYGGAQVGVTVAAP